MCLDLDERARVVELVERLKARHLVLVVVLQHALVAATERRPTCERAVAPHVELPANEGALLRGLGVAHSDLKAAAPAWQQRIGRLIPGVDPRSAREGRQPTSFGAVRARAHRFSHVLTRKSSELEHLRQRVLAFALRSKPAAGDHQCEESQLSSS